MKFLFLHILIYTYFEEIHIIYLINNFRNIYKFYKNAAFSPCSNLFFEKYSIVQISSNLSQVWKNNVWNYTAVPRIVPWISYFNKIRVELKLMHRIIIDNRYLIEYASGPVAILYFFFCEGIKQYDMFNFVLEYFAYMYSTIVTTVDTLTVSV